MQPLNLIPKKKILVFIDWYLPGTKSGGPVRSIANLIAHFNGEFEFLLVTRDIDYCETKAYEDIESNKWNTMGENTKVFYISHNNLNTSFLRRLIKSTAFDIAYINGIYSKFFSILPVYFLRNSRKPVIVVARGMLNSQAFSVKPLKKKIFLALLNLGSFYRNIEFHATNEGEADFIAKAIGKYQRIKIAPNLPRKTKALELKYRHKADITKFISVARVAREKGTLTTLQGFLGLGTSRSIVYDIYGPVYDQEYWKECKEIIELLPENIQVAYKGSVESDRVPGILEEYHFFIMPSEGENYGHGIVEAFTAGCPVLISDNTPWTHLETQKVGWDVPLTDSAALVSGLEAAIEMDQETYNSWSQQALLYSKQIIENEEILNLNRSLFSKE